MIGLGSVLQHGLKVQLLLNVKLLPYGLLMARSFGRKTALSDDRARHSTLPSHLLEGTLISRALSRAACWLYSADEQS